MALSLSLGPAAPADAEPPPPEPSAALPDYREAPPATPQPPPAPAKVKVPADGAGMIVLGSLLVAAGSAVAISSGVIHLTQEDPYATGLGAFLSIPTGVSGLVVLSLGLVVRRQHQHRKTEAGRDLDAPPTGNGMLLSGIGLMAGGTIAAAVAGIDLATEVCSGDPEVGCQPVRPIGAPIQLGLSIAAATTGVVLTSFGIRRRRDYKQHARARQLALWPTVSASSTRLALGVGGRF